MPENFYKAELSEVIQEKNNYREIKPKGEFTHEEAKSFLKNMISEKKDETDEQQDSNELTKKPDVKDVDGKKHYYDDNGNLYRIDGNLLPNCEYEINGYKYKTDEKGRIISAEGTLHMKDDRKKRPIRDSMDDIGKGDQKEGDDRGHLIGDRFDGGNGIENMIPQDAEINEKDFRNFEGELANIVKSGQEVYYKVEPVYNGESRRPEAIVVTYTIEGKENIRIFPNGKGEK